MHRSRLKHTRGYTLIEMIVVLIIISVIAGIALRSGQSSISNSRTEEAKRKLDQIANAIAGDPQKTSGGARVDFGYVGDVGALPASLANLTTNPGSYTTWRGPYLRDEFTADGTSPGLSTDPWGVAYSYNSSTGSVTSSGSGSSITRQVAASPDDLLRNRVKIMIRDRSMAIPGTIYDDSLSVLLTIPNGSGATTTKTRTPSPDGIAVFDSIPMGSPIVRVCYAPTHDTIQREFEVLPNETTQVAVQLPTSAWANMITMGMYLVLYPNGVGSETALTTSGCAANWQCVDDTVADESSTYLTRSNGSYANDTYTLTDPATSTGSIDSVKIFARAYGNHSQSEVQGRIRPTTTTYTGAIMSMNGITTYTNFSWSWSTNPQTSMAWTWADLTNLQAGIGMKKNSFCTSVFVRVYYH